MAKAMGLEEKPWTNRVAVITGGASGIGEATVAEFLGRGAKVVVLDRAAAGSNVSDEMVYIPCDVSSGREIEAAASRVSSELGRVSFWLIARESNVTGRA